MTKLAQEYGSSRHLFERLNQALNSSKNALDKSKIDDQFWTHKFFTDNLVIGYLARPHSAFNIEAMLGEAIHLAATHQLSMALNGFAVRGALTMGDQFIGRDLVFGDCLVRAHELESDPSISRSPRIVISDECKDVLWLDSGFLDTVFRDDDGRIFINYLNYQYYGFYEENLGSNVLERHKGFVEKGLNDFSGHKQTYRKYLWLAAYHNFFCKNMPYSEDQYYLHDSDKLLIANIDEVGIERISEEEFRSESIQLHKRLYK